MKALPKTFWEGIIRRGGFGAIHNVLSAKRFNQIQRQAEDRGFLAGRVFLRVMQMVRAKRSPVVNKAFDLVAKEVRHPESMFDEELEPKSRSLSSLKSCWSEYRHVAHWWAASWLMWDQFLQKPGLDVLIEMPVEEAIESIRHPPPHPHSQEGLPYLNTTAESLLEMAAGITIGEAANTPRPLLDPDTAMRLPPSFPKDADPLEVPELEDWAKNYLNTH